MPTPGRRRIVLRSLVQQLIDLHENNELNERVLKRNMVSFVDMLI